MVDVRIEGETIVGEVEIDAPAERIFRALTDPEELRAWWGSPESYRIDEWRSDLRVGGAWESLGKGAAGRPFRVHGSFVEIDPPRRLVYTWNPSWIEGAETTVVYELTPVQGRSGRTRVRVRHEGFGADLTALDNHARGWPAVLGWLHAHCEGRGRRESPAAGGTGRPGSAGIG